MQTRNDAMRVGGFVILASAILCGLILQFGKIQQRFENYYHVTVKFRSFTQVAVNAGVTMSGVPIGKVGRIDLAPDSRSVVVRLDIIQGRGFRKDVRIVLRQSGLLGDMYLEVMPKSDTAAFVVEGDVIEGDEPPPEIGELISEGAQVLRKLNSAVTSIEHVARTLDEKILTPQTADDVRQSLSNIRQVTTNMMAVSASLSDVVKENKPKVEASLASVQQAATNLVNVIHRADKLVQNADELVAENRVAIRETIRNIDDGTAKVSAIVSRLQNGEGTAGKLLTDPTLHDELTRLIANWRRFGILYKEGTPKQPAGSGQGYIFGGGNEKSK